MEDIPGHGGRRAGAGRRSGVADPDTLRYNKGKADEKELDVHRKKVKLQNELDGRRKGVGDLVPYDEVRREFTEYVNIVNMTFETLPDILERNTGISGNVVAELQLHLDKVRRALQEKLESNFGAT